MPDRLANYVPVAERVTQAQNELIAVEADPPVMMTEAMGYIRVAVYLSDGRKATGTASFRLDLDGRSAQATNPIEDCETSAVGRALAFLGFSSNRAIASREEVRTAQQRGATYEKPPVPPANGKDLADLITRIEALVAEGVGIHVKLPVAPKPLNQMSKAELIAHGKALRAAVEEAKSLTE